MFYLINISDQYLREDVYSDEGIWRKSYLQVYFLIFYDLVCKSWTYLDRKATCFVNLDYIQSGLVGYLPWEWG